MALSNVLAGATTSVVSETTAGATFGTTTEAIDATEEATEDIDGTDISQTSTGSLGIHVHRFVFHALQGPDQDSS